MKPTKRMPTMGDVARHAGVSPATVARVLNDPEKVSEEKRLRIRAALEATGYRPNAAARGLRTQRSWTIGLLMVDGSLNPFFSQLGQAIRSEALARGYNVLIYQHGMSARREAEAVAQLLQQRADAVIFAYAVTATGLQPLIDAGTPIVQIEQYLRPDTDSVLIDPRPGIEAAVAHLVSLGHHRIGFIGGDPARYARTKHGDTTQEGARLAAMRDACARLGTDADPDLTQLGLYFSTGQDDPASEGREMMQTLLGLPQPPTAVIAAGDILAAGALQAIGASGLRVPQDISVIGFDNSIANLLSPPLTSIGRPLDKMAQCAIDMVLEAVQTPAARQRCETFDTFLVERASVGPMKPEWPAA